MKKEKEKEKRQRLYEVSIRLFHQTVFINYKKTIIFNK